MQKLWFEIVMTELNIVYSSFKLLYIYIYIYIYNIRVFHHRWGWYIASYICANSEQHDELLLTTCVYWGVRVISNVVKVWVTIGLGKSHIQ